MIKKLDIIALIILLVLIAISSLRLIIVNPTYEKSAIYIPVFINNSAILDIITGGASYKRDGKLYDYKGEVLHLGDYIIIHKTSRVNIIENRQILKAIETGEQDKIYLIFRLCNCDLQNIIEKDGGKP